MDDLAGLDWNASSSKSTSKPTAPSGSNYFPALRPTPPVSGRSTPAAPASLPKPATPQSNVNTGPAKDSFANLFQSSSANSTKNLSLAEQQRRLQEQKAKQLTAGAGAGATEDAWARLGGTSSGAVTPGSFNLSRPGSTQPSTASLGLGQGRAYSPKPPQSLTKEKEDEDDLLAAFKADAPVDKSSHFPAPVSASSSARATPAPAFMQGGNDFGAMPDDDDDPFGLGMSNGTASYNRAPLQPILQADDDDFLGDLAKPVSEIATKRAAAPARPAQSEIPDSGTGDRAVAELVDMGFPAEKAQEALEATGGEVQAAVSWLLTQAHSEARNRSRTPAGDERESRRPTERQNSQRRNGTSPANGEKDPGQVASELGASLWKGANSLWKTGKKHINKAVQDFNEGGDPSQPKWMREASSSRPSSAASGRPRQDKQQVEAAVTDEAMMLDSHDARPAPRSRRQDTGSGAGASPSDSARTSRDQSPALPSRPSSNAQARPAWQQPAPSARSKLSRQVVEEETAQAYVSPARRKKATPKPAETEPDLLNGGSAPVPTSRPQSNLRQSTQSPSAKPSAPVPVRPAAKTRAVPTVSTIAMKSVNQHRSSGTAAFKRGDYGVAAESYSSAITALPAKHPLVILLYTNRATTRVKTGDSKGALSDADAAIELIGPARGSGEAIDVPAEDGSGSSSKDMGQFWGKAMMRRAEALEHMERWTDAGAAWKECVAGGVGGALSIQGRNRCDQAAGKASKPKPAAPVRKAPAKAVASRPAASRAAESFEAVNKMREANKAAEAVEEEKFRLADIVDERINTWRKGKEANLRALLGSLDTVLWADSGWKKVGMSELLEPKKVKLAYTKGIGRTHPDKLPTTATTEQQMISAAVFATLNEAWDKFKAENGL